jgi:hypothetical protein
MSDVVCDVVYNKQDVWKASFFFREMYYETALDACQWRACTEHWEEFDCKHRYPFEAHV